MTLCTIGPFANFKGVVYFVSGVRSDAFVIKADDNTYHFCGLTKTERGYEFNDRFFWKEYYALDEDRGLGIAQAGPNQWKFVLLNKGKEEISVECDRRLWHPCFSRKPTLVRFSNGAHMVEWRHDPDQWSSWAATNECLQNVSCHNTKAARLLSVLQEWESISMQTIDWVETQIKTNSKWPQDMEICAAGRWWIWLDRLERVVTIGMGEQEWGKAPLPSCLRWVGFNWVSPVRHGWLADFSHGERYLIHWSGRDVVIQPLFFPCGEWERQEQWILWHDDCVMFTPNKQLVAVEPWFKIIGVSKQWAFLKLSQNWDRQTAETDFCLRVIDGGERRVFFKASRFPENQIEAVDQSGNLHTTTLPIGRNEKLEEIHVGDQSMLITTICEGAYVLTIADTSDLPPSLRLRTILFRDTRGHIVHVLRGNPDAYAIIFQERKTTLIRILVIDAWGRAWLVPQTFSFPFLSNVLDIIKVKGSQLIVDLVDEQRNPIGCNLVIEMKDGTGTMCFPDGVTAHSEGVELENNLTALEKYLLQHISYGF